MDPLAELPDGNPKTVHGMSKPGLEGVPAAPLFMVGEVMRFGAHKYGLTNWRHEPISASVYYNAAMRHLLSWWDGENLDSESQLPHLAHAVACLMIILDARLSDDLNDDRPSAGLTSTYLASRARYLEKQKP